MFWVKGSVRLVSFSTRQDPLAGPWLSAAKVENLFLMLLQQQQQLLSHIKMKILFTSPWVACWSVGLFGSFLLLQ